MIPLILVVKNPIAWLAHRCTPINKKIQADAFLLRSALVMSPLWLGLFEPCVLKQPLGLGKVPMFFWGPPSGPGVIKKRWWVLRYATVDVRFFLNRP